ncbi:hypothetical protein OKW35_000316 [Paraburkholderia sp. MM5477-R1]
MAPKTLSQTVKLLCIVESGIAAREVAARLDAIEA